MKTIVIAIGGNAILPKNKKQTSNNLIESIKKVCTSLTPILQKNKVVITHGNGPEIGFLSIQNELAKKKVPPMPLDILGAESQALIGYPLEEQLVNKLRNTKKEVVTLLTQVLVDKEDPAFKNPTKFIGPYFSRKPKSKNKIFKEDSGKGYRRVVPSPKPVKILETNAIKRLIQNNFIVIAAGGGGIPVYRYKEGLTGVEAVIDKDFTSSLLANSIKAKTLLILTGVKKVSINFNKKNNKFLKTLNIKQAEEYLAQGQFPPGNMGPKIEASLQFLKKGGKEVIITDIKNAHKALIGKEGTKITKR